MDFNVRYVSPLRPPPRDDRCQLSFAGGAHLHLCAVIKKDGELFHVVHRLAAEQGMRAAGIVADHSSNGAAAMRGRIWSKHQVVLLDLLLQRIQDDARLYARKLLPGIHFQDLIHVLGKVEHHSDIAALARQAGARAAREYGCAERPAHGDGGDHIIGIKRYHQSDGELPIVRPIGGVKRAAAAIKADLAAYFLLQFSFQLRRLRKRINRLGVRAGRQWRLISQIAQATICAAGVGSGNWLDGFIQKAMTAPNNSRPMLPTNGSSQLCVLSMIIPPMRGERMAAAAEPVFIRPLAEPEKRGAISMGMAHMGPMVNSAKKNAALRQMAA